MNDSGRFQRVAGISAILLPLITTGNVITLFAPINNNANALTDPALLLSVGARGANLFHWSMVFDIFSYLAFAPLALFCWVWFKDQNRGMVLLYTCCGLAYSFLGSIGAAILGAVIPKMINDYAAASAAQQEAMRIVAGTFYQAISHGVWNPLEILMVSLWFLGIGWRLLKERRGLGILALVISSFALLDPLGWILNNDLIFNIGGGGTILIQFWSLLFGIDLLRRRVPVLESLQPASGQQRG
jgi:hypothetical protein